jgi:hypothetical protein
MLTGLRTCFVTTFAAVLIASVVGAASAAELLWYGQSAFKITTPGGKVILVDPFITKNPKPAEPEPNRMM